MERGKNQGPEAFRIGLRGILLREEEPRTRAVIGKDFVGSFSVGVARIRKRRGEQLIPYP